MAYTQGVTPYLRRFVNTAVREYGYRSVGTFLNGRADVALRTAIKLTDAKYPEAMNRTGVRRPKYIRGRPHLRNSWKVDKSGNVGENRQIALVNNRPLAAMLIMGINNPSTITPKNFMYKPPWIKRGKKIPVLVWPKNPDQRTPVPFGRTVKMPKTVVRPVPQSQIQVDPAQSIPYEALKYAFVSAADRRIRRVT